MSVARPFSTVPPSSLRDVDLLLAGPWGRDEFLIIHADLRLASRRPMVATLPAALAQIADSPYPPEVLLLAAPCGGSVGQQAFDDLLRLAPLCRLIVVGGCWCEGSLRTAPPILGSLFLYWHEFAAWWRLVGRCGMSDVAPPWSRPLDELRAGQWLGDATTIRSPSEAANPLVLVNSADYETFEALAESLAEFGCDVHWQPRGRSGASSKKPAAAKCGVWDGGQLDSQELQDFTSFVAEMKRNIAPVLALLDYPRTHHIAQIAGAGGAALLGKPYQATLLAAEVFRLIFPVAV